MASKKTTGRTQERRRNFLQIGWMALTNGYLAGFLQGKLYQGPLKAVCVPGLNCYSCPGAFFSCPIGSLQAVLGSRDYSISYYALGFLLFFGGLLGRLTCGFLCPFGWIQDALFRIPCKKIEQLPAEAWLQRIRYVVLAVFVVLLPLLATNIIGAGSPWFCKLVCPSGTLFGGIPLYVLDPNLRQAAGGLFVWKVSLLVALLAAAVFLYRPFCRYLCPLGAVYGACNPVSVYRLRVDENACTGCKACERACKLHIPVYKTPNSTACIRCGACKSACPSGAISSTFSRKNGLCASGGKLSLERKFDKET